MTKRIISLLVAAMMVLALIPAAAFAKTEAPAEKLAFEPVQRGTNAVSRVTPKAEPVKDAFITWDFEEDPTTSGWNFLDADNDGKNWTWTTETTANSGTHTIKSASYESGALTPDNWAQSPYFDMPEGGATLSFWVKNYNANYPEVFEVWYGFEGGPGMNPVATNQSVTGTAWTQVSYQIPDSEGARGMIAIRHYGCTDMWKFYVDDVEISAPADPYMIPTVEVDGFPTKIYAGQTPDEVLANITIPDDAHYMITEISAYDVETESQLDGGDQFEEGKSYLLGVSVETDLDYYFAEDAELLANGGALELDIGYSSVTTYIAFVVPVAYVCGGEAPIYGWYFETEDELEGWAVIDNDGDDSSWYWLNNNSFGAGNYDQYAYEGEGFMGSPSWNSTALTPDNYLLTPELEIPEGTTTLSFYAAGLGASYCQEHFAVYAVPEGASTVDEFTEILPETVATADYVNYTIDLSDYAGQSICIAFRHFNCTDMNWLRLDQVEIFNEGGDEPEPTVITEVAINGIVPPEDGMIADEMIENYSVPSDANYAVSFIEVYCAGFQDPISLSTELHANGETDDYYLIIYFGANEGYVFDENFTATVNGGEIGVHDTWLHYNGDAAVRTENMTIEAAAELITEIDIEGFVEPEWGANPFYGVTVPEDAHYSKIQGLWYRYNASGPMNPDDTFNDPDEQYYMYFFFVPMEGYEFADDVTVLINGSAALVFFSTAENGGISVYTNYFTVQPPVGPPITDLDLALNIPGGELHFESEGEYPWFTVEEGDRFYAQSGNAGVSSSSSTLTTTVTLEAGAVITFDFKAWGEGTGSFWDHCDFYVNGTRVLYYGAYDNDWETFTYVVEEAGEYTLTWVYTKDSSVNPNGDYFAVDNVYIGEPVLPEAINVFDVTVEEGRYTYVVYTIDPDNATDTAVTYAIEDTSIATVDENGAIHGVAVGETTITVTSVSNPEVFGTATVTVTEAGPAVALYGFGCYDISGTNTYKWVTFTDVDPGTVTALSEMNNTYAAAYYDGYIYGYRQTDGQFYKVNAETFEVEYLSLAINDTALDMAYNYADHTMYLLAQREEGGSYPIYLMTVDLETGEATDVGMVFGVNSGSLLTLAIDGEGNAYGLATGSNAVLYSVDLATGECTEIGATGIGMNYIQSMHYDINTGRLFWAQIYSTSSNGLYEIDPETGAAEFLGVIGTSGMEITGLYTIYDEGTEPPEPVIIDEIEINDFEIPVYGANPDFDFTVPEGAHYFIEDVGWTVYDPETGDTAMAPEDVFDNPNATYYAVIILGCEEGYDFPDEAIVMINGETALVDFSFGYEGEYYIATVDFTVEEPVIGILGDVDLNGTVEVADAILALRYAMGLVELTDEQLAQMDVDGNGEYNLIDATLILRYAMGLIENFPAEPIAPPLD